MRTKKQVSALLLARYPKFKTEKGETDVTLGEDDLELGRYAREGLNDAITEVGKMQALTGTFRLVKTVYGPDEEMFKRVGLTEEEYDRYGDDFDFEVVVDPREELDKFTDSSWHILLKAKA